MILKAVYGPADGSTPANAALLTENPGEVLDTLPGFKLDHVLEADGPRHGSWICMANESKGRLLLGGQGGQPITRVTLLNGKSMLDEILHIPVTETMGMLFVDKVLYLNGSGSKRFGLYRCWFTDDGVNFNNGASFDGFVRNALAEVKASMSPAELAAMGDLTKVQSAIATPPAPRAFVKEWTTADLLPLLDKVGKGRDFARGKAAFTSAQCILCHRYGDQGGAT